MTVPRKLWRAWLSEGDLAGSPWTGAEYGFGIPSRPKIEPGERVYIVSCGRIRGYSPLVYLTEQSELFGLRSKWVAVRRAEGVAVTIPEKIRGFQGYRYRFWPYEQEIPFPDWQTA